MIGRMVLEQRLPELRPKLHRYCARMTGSVIDGEDVLQETLLKALAAIERSNVQNLEHWLFRIAQNAAYDHLRKQAARLETSAEVDMTALRDPTAAADSRHVAALSMRTFMHLPMAQRSTVILVDVLGLSLHETCEITGATLAATKAALHRGRTLLRAVADEPIPPPTLAADDEKRLRRYVDLFNARDFDAIRALIGEEVRLELVNNTRTRGKAEVSRYFGNYDLTRNWRLSLGLVDGWPAILVHNPLAEGEQPWSFMLLEWHGDTVAAIRDFRYAPYALAEAKIDKLA